ncbi:MAG: DsbA family protein [Alphaproteobacteria bacterium]|nr:DsbA family protein [Alphaproteobacteria bacterium]
MAQKSNRFVWGVIIAVIASAAGIGYYSNSLELREIDAANVNANAAQAEPDKKEQPETPFDASALTVRSDDIVIGKANAANTVVEYASLSCPHCAHFHKEMLPEIKKQLIDTGKMKHVLRYFPLNQPAFRAAMLVECGAKADRLKLMEELYAKQDEWAFTPQFLDKLKEIGAANGIDSAAFDSCISDAALETKVLGSRKEGMEKLHVKGTPSFFLNGAPMVLKDGLTTEAFIKAVEAPKETK